MAGFGHVKEGDLVTRLLAGQIPMELLVYKVDEGMIYCCPPGMEDPSPGWTWTFDRLTGAEIDEQLGWGPSTHTGSVLKEIQI